MRACFVIGRGSATGCADWTRTRRRAVSERRHEVTRSRINGAGEAKVEQALETERQLKEVLVRPVEAKLLPFGSFALGQLLLLSGADPRTQSQDRNRLEDACDLWLYRHDEQISPEMYNETMECLTAHFRHTIGVDKMMIALSVLYSLYFDSNWKSLDTFLQLNKPRIDDIRAKYGKRGPERRPPEQELTTKPQFQAVTSLSVLTFDSFLLSHGDERPVAIMFRAKYCSNCRNLMRHFIRASQELRGAARFASVDGPENLPLVVTNAINSYPTVRLYINGKAVSELNVSNPTSAAIISAFVTSSGEANGTKPMKDFPVRGDDDGQPNTSAFDVLKQHGIDEEDEIMLDRERTIEDRISSELRKSGVVIGPIQRPDKKLVCSLENLESCVDNTSGRKPILIFMGGGMGSGKTAVRKVLETTKLWKERGDQIVIVEADVFKHIDPVYQALSSVTTSASRMVHSSSTRAAEELLVKAVAARRDILFDSSMAWAPFITQTVEMVRDSGYVYCRGPGEQTDSNGLTTEKYWEKVGPSKRNEQPPDYHLELVGVTVPPQVAVCRGMTRMLQTGRGVPVRDQLESHRLFSASFEMYAGIGGNERGMFDGVTLLDNSGEEPSDPLTKPTGELKPTVVAARGGLLVSAGGVDGSLEFLVPEKYNSFISKQNINSDADNSRELFSTTINR